MKMYRNSVNLFDKNNTTVGWTSGTGVTTADTFGAQYKFDLTNITSIVVKANATLPNSYSFCWYDSNDTFISRTHFGSSAMSNVNSAIVPANATSCVFQVSCGSAVTDVMTQEMLDSYQLMLNFGTLSYPYEPFNVIDWYSYYYNKYNGYWQSGNSSKEYSGGSWS